MTAARFLLLLLLAGSLLSSASAAPATGAEISGRIVAAGDSTALAGANVYLEKTGEGSLAGEGGSFRFAVEPGPQLLVISFVGYRTRSVSTSRSERGNPSISAASSSRRPRWSCPE